MKNENENENEKDVTFGEAFEKITKIKIVQSLYRPICLS